MRGVHGTPWFGALRQDDARRDREWHAIESLRSMGHHEVLCRHENDEIGNVLERWNAEGSLKGTFLVEIGSEICQRKKTPKGDEKGEGKGEGGYVLDDVVDKVVQDDDSSEGTGFWSAMEGAWRHVSAPTIATGQFLRYASGQREERLKVAK